MKLSSIVLTIVILGVGFAATGYMRENATKPPEVQQAEPEVSVAVIAAEIRSHQPRIAIIGQIEAKDEAALTSPLETEVLAVFFEEGDAVSKGEPLLELDTRDTFFQLEAQLAGIDDINAQLESLQTDLAAEDRRLAEILKLRELAAEELARNEKLLERGVVAQAAVDGAVAAVSARDLEIIAQRQKTDGLQTSRKRLNASKRASLAQAGQLRLVLERARLQAPFDGVVKVMEPSVGSRVSRGQPLVQLYDPASLRLRAAIPNEYSRYAFEGVIEGELAVDGVVQRVALANVAPEAKPGRGSVDALFELPASDWLLGATLDFDLLLPPQERNVAVPFDALYSGSRVYIVDADSRAQAVECAASGQTSVDGRPLALLRCDGLSDGDRIVVNRIPNLISGTKLRVS
ncbi:MAG: HlyD family efflux transporter periplasmic adaptor subunit [Betaproteobacteria bacterium AqS2]|uniref:HlyD family efflux transporter periplasmic adaptor subunit n=1 Tax=Candidatus Amphirhobacter heronislandensis TaxID=1732024 RepID=A0A930UDI1_9GAMM|nr:HlyD family efflux transporter periplasmic adaptor subunit [Betaproteobacteria bacterium AqS2]